MINDVRKGPEHFAPGLFAAYQGGADAPHADVTGKLSLRF